MNRHCAGGVADVVVTYRNTIDTGERVEVVLVVDDERWEGVLDLANKHFCGHLPALPDVVIKRAGVKK